MANLPSHWVEIQAPMDAAPSIQPGPEVPHEAGGEVIHFRKKKYGHLELRIRESFQLI